MYFSGPGCHHICEDLMTKLCEFHATCGGHNAIAWLRQAYLEMQEYFESNLQHGISVYVPPELFEVNCD